MEDKSAASSGCSSPEARLAALLDGELPRQEAEMLGAYVRGCPRCAADLARQRAAQAALQSIAPALLPSPALLTSLQTRLDAAQPRHARRRWIDFFRGMAVLLALLSALAMLGRVQRGPSRVMDKTAGSGQVRALSPSVTAFEVRNSQHYLPPLQRLEYGGAAPILG